MTALGSLSQCSASRNVKNFLRPHAEVELLVSPSHARSGDTGDLWGADCLPHHIQHLKQHFIQ